MGQDRMTGSGSAREAGGSSLDPHRVEVGPATTLQRGNIDMVRDQSRSGRTVNCEHCGAELPQGASTCPACGATVSLMTKTGDVAERTGEKTVEVGMKVGKGALRLGGKALSGVGTLAKKAGKKVEEAGKKK